MKNRCIFASTIPLVIPLIMPLFMPRFLPLYIPLNKVKDAATKQRLWDNLMATVGTAVTTAAVGTTGMSLTVVMGVVVTLGFRVIV